MIIYLSIRNPSIMFRSQSGTFISWRSFRKFPWSTHIKVTDCLDLKSRLYWMKVISLIIKCVIEQPFCSPY